MIKKIIAFSSLFLIIAVNCFAADKYQWQLVDTSRDCQVYTSTVPGKDYIAAKATCVVPARRETVGVILREIANYPEWMEDCKETRVLKTVDDQNEVFIFWFRQHVPLLTDRDMVLKSKVVIDTAKCQSVVYANSTDEIKYDPGKGYIRMPSFSSFTSIDWMDREHTRITFMIDPDLGPGLPKGMANMMIKTNPLKSLKRLMKLLKNPKYIEAGRTSKYYKLAEEGIKAGCPEQ